MPNEVADGVFQLAPLPYVNVVVVRGAEGWTLIDAGLSPTQGRLVAQLRGLGIGRGDVDRIVLTHGHLDHAGAAEGLRRELGAREVLVGGADLAEVRRGANASGEPGSPLSRLPADIGYPPVPSAAAMPDDPIVLDDARSLVPVATPGHTDGHVAFHLPDCDVVAGGDTMFNVFRLRPAPTFLCADQPRNHASILRLAELRPRTLLLAHGDPVHGDVEGRLRSVIRA